MSSTEVNILLLGATGVGKSTLINSIANYIKYESLNEAKTGFHCLIPVTFHLNQNLESVAVCIGSDTNENTKTERSGTLKPCKHSFRYGERVVNIIDTPGFANTEGIYSDHVNTKDIINFIKKLKEISAVCVVLKCNETTMNIPFEYCIRKILGQLNHGIKENVLFIFTHAWGTSYKIGDLPEALKKLLADITIFPEVFANENTFLFENMCFRYLTAHSKGVQFNEEEETTYAESWQRSWNVCHRFLEVVLKLKPSPTKIIVKIRDANAAIAILAESLVEMMILHEKCISQIKEHEDDVKEYQNSKHDLESRLLVPIIEYKTSEKKVTSEEKGPTFGLDFILKLVPEIKVGYKRQNVVKTQTETTSVPYDTNKEDPCVKTALSETEEKLSTVKQNLDELKKTEQECTEELNIMKEVAITIIAFLESNAIGFNNPFEEYIKRILNEVKICDESSSFIDSLNRLRLSVTFKKENLPAVGTEDLNRALIELLSLKHAGLPFRQLCKDILE